MSTRHVVKVSDLISFVYIFTICMLKLSKPGNKVSSGHPYNLPSVSPVQSLLNHRKTNWKISVEPNFLDHTPTPKKNQLNNSLENALLNCVSYCNVQMCLKRLQLENWF